jgi:PAS domain S-box-containing protein
MARDNALPSLDGEQNELLLEALPIIVWTTSPDGMTNYANAAWLGYTGLSREKTLAGAVRSAVHQDDLQSMDDRWQRARAAETAFEIEYRLLRGDGVYRWHLARVVPLRGRDGQITGWLGSATDIHDRKQLEEERAEFLALITHDLKNPLTSILGTAELLRRRAARIAELADRDRLDEGLSAIFQSAQRMTAQIDALFDLASTQSGSSLELHTEPTDLAELLGQLLDEHRLASERHTFRLTLADTPLVGTWDSKRIERAIANVLTNAVKYSPMGGQVDVSARHVHLEGVDWAEVAVTDRGIGIPARDLPHVFERFYRAHNVAGLIAGTGLGLSGVRQIVEHHGGNVTAASLEGQGTTITIRLPLAG